MPILTGSTTHIGQYQKFGELLQKNVGSSKKQRYIHTFKNNQKYHILEIDLYFFFGGGGGLEAKKNCDTTGNLLIWVAPKKLRIGAEVERLKPLKILTILPRLNRLKLPR